jgi:hypothetical protein
MAILLSKILHGTHVIIDDVQNFIIKINGVPDEKKCHFVTSKFHFSRETISVQSSAW